MTTGHTTIDNHTLWILLVESFRYCLGRRTGAVSTCADNLMQYWDLFPTFIHKQIHDDINQAIEFDHAGDKCDIRQWQRILQLPVRAE